MAITKPEEQQAPKAPAQNKKEFRPLVVGDRIDRCAYILPNVLQCWKAGEEEVTEYLVPSVKDAKTQGAQAERRTYQFCERHTRIQKAIDAGALTEEQINTPMKEMTIENTTGIPATPQGFEAAPADQTQAEQESVHPVQYETKEEAEQLKTTVDTKKQQVEAAQQQQQSSPPQKDQGGFFHHQE